MSDSQLGSLSQSARQKQLKSARTILLFIGILTLVVNGFVIATAKSSVEKQAQVLQQQGFIVDIDKAVQITQLVAGGAAALGIVFIVFGVIVNKFPVPITISALVLYIGAAAVFALIDPTTLLQGLIIKIVIIVGLVKSVSAALAYQKELDSAATPEPA